MPQKKVTQEDLRDCRRQVREELERIRTKRLRQQLQTKLMDAAEVAGLLDEADVAVPAPQNGAGTERAG